MDLITLSYAGITSQEYKQLQKFDYQVLPDKLKRKIRYARTLNPLFLKKTLAEKNIEVVTIRDPLYPTLLKQIYDPPYVLFMRGERALLNRKMIGIVGSRKATSYSKKALEVLLPPLKDFVIVSGLAYGADAMAHSTCLQYNIKTIGVLAFGHDIHYPKTTEKTRLEIEQKGLTLSEYPPHSTIEKWKFVGRNRLIAGLSRGVLVTEAEEKSGSLITLEMAVNENRAAMCIPGNMTSPYSRGTNRRIQEGAKTVISYADILEEVDHDFSV
jgi:DNA processing protein